MKIFQELLKFAGQEGDLHVRGNISEMKMLVKQNTYISLAFLKKLTRERSENIYKQLASFASLIEGGNRCCNLKESVRELLRAQKMGLERTVTNDEHSGRAEEFRTPR